MENTFTISTDKTHLNIDMIVDFLNNKSYWGKETSRATIEKSIKNSMCFGVYYAQNIQIGFAQVITDYAILGWVSNVFILEAYRGKGLSKLLMQTIIDHEDLKELTGLKLGTLNAHGLYAQFGFTPLAAPERMMELMFKKAK